MGNSFDGFDPQEKIKQLLAENALLRIAQKDLEGQNALLRKALKLYPEWKQFSNSMESYSYCYFCGSHKPHGHAQDCLRQRALGKEAQDV